MISLFLAAALEGRDIPVLGDEKMTRDFAYVKDVVRAIVLALLREEEGGGRRDVRRLQRVHWGRR